MVLAGVGVRHGQRAGNVVRVRVFRHGARGRAADLGRVVRPGDRDRDRGRVRASAGIADGVGERVRSRFFSRRQRLELAVWVVVKGPIAIVLDRAQVAQCRRSSAR